MLLLLALEEREFRIEVGYGLEGALNDAKTGRIQDDYIIPYLKDDNWDEGIRNGYSKILQEVSNEYGVDVGEITIKEPEDSGELYSGIGTMVFLFLTMFLAKTKKTTKIIILVIDIIAVIATFIFKANLANNIFAMLCFIEFLTLVYTIISLITKGSGTVHGVFFGGSGGGSSFGGGRSFGDGGSSGGGGSSRRF